MATWGVPKKPAATADLRLVVGAVNLLLTPLGGSCACSEIALQDTGRADKVCSFGQAQGRSNGGLEACPLTSIQNCPCTCRVSRLYLDDSGALGIIDIIIRHRCLGVER